MHVLVQLVKVAAVFGLLAFTLRYLRTYDGKLAMGRRHSDRPVEVLGQAKLSKGASVAVVRVGTCTYAVGVTDQRITLLSPGPVELPADLGPADTASAGAWAPDPEAALLDRARALLAEQPDRPTFVGALRDGWSQLATRRSVDGSTTAAPARMPER